MAAKTMQGCNWVFTLNNPQPEENPSYWPSRYIVYQLEKGESGTPHYQGYVVFHSNKTLAAVKKLNPRAHWDLRRGTHEQAVHYTTKPHPECTCEHCAKCTPDSRIEPPVEKGIPPITRGKRTDLLLVKQLLDEGATESEICRNEDCLGTVARYPKLIGMYRMATQQHRNFKTQVLVLFGPPKKGKSAFWNICYPDAYIKPHGIWWDGYDNQETVVIDDFYGWLPYSFMLQLLDRYPLLVEVKGGMRTFNSKRIIITSNKAPSLWYGLDCSYPPLERRLDVVYRFEEDRVRPTLLKGSPLCFNWEKALGREAEAPFQFPVPPDFYELPPPDLGEVPSPIPTWPTQREYIDVEDGQRVLRPNFPPNPAAK